MNAHARTQALARVEKERTNLGALQLGGQLLPRRQQTLAMATPTHACYHTGDGAWQEQRRRQAQGLPWSIELDKPNAGRNLGHDVRVCQIHNLL